MRNRVSGWFVVVSSVLVLVTMAAVAGAQSSDVPCTLSLDGTEVTPPAGARDRPLVVSTGDELLVVVSSRGTVDELTIRLQSSAVLDAGPVLVRRSNLSSNSWQGTIRVHERISTGLYAIEATATGCQRTIWVEVDGSPATAVTGIATGIGLGGIVALLFGIGRPRRGALAVLGGLGFGIGVGAIAHQLGLPVPLLDAVVIVAIVSGGLGLIAHLLARGAAPDPTDVEVPAGAEPDPIIDLADDGPNAPPAHADVAPSAPPAPPIGVPTESPYTAPPQASAPPPPEAPVDEVHLGASAPAAVRPGRHFTARFAAYLAYHEDEVTRRFAASGSNEVHLGLSTCRWTAGTRVDVVVTGADDLRVEEPSQTFEWNGGVVDLSWDVTVAEDARDDVTVLRYDVFIEGVRIAKLRLDLTIADAEKPHTLVEEHLEAATTAFASYASEDSARVLDRVASIRSSTGIDVFIDCLSLQPNEAWKTRLQREIDERDLFLLFWSRHTVDSEWVEWEWRRALEKDGVDPIQLHPLDTVADAPPPEELAHLHHGDAMMLVRKGIEG